MDGWFWVQVVAWGVWASCWMAILGGVSGVGYGLYRLACWFIALRRDANAWRRHRRALECFEPYYPASMLSRQAD